MWGLATSQERKCHSDRQLLEAYREGTCRARPRTGYQMEWLEDRSRNVWRFSVLIRTVVMNLALNLENELDCTLCSRICNLSLGFSLSMEDYTERYEAMLDRHSGRMLAADLRGLSISSRDKWRVALPSTFSHKAIQVPMKLRHPMGIASG